MAKLTKKAKALAGQFDRDKLYGIDEAIAALKGAASKKMNETIEIAMNLGVDPRHADQMVRGVVTLPAGTGKDVKVAVFARGANAEAALAAGADKVGAEDLMEDMQAGNLDYDRVIATPDMMGIVGRLGKVLGPKGLMPNPKVGTVTTDLTKAITDIKAGKVEYRVDKTAIIHCPVGKASFGAEKLGVNLKALMDAINKAKPATAKGIYVRSLYLSATMGPAVKVNPLKF